MQSAPSLADVQDGVVWLQKFARSQQLLKQQTQGQHVLARTADQLKGYQLAPVTDFKGLGSNVAKPGRRAPGVRPQAIEQADAKSTPGSTGTGQAKKRALPLKRTREVFEGECIGRN